MLARELGARVGNRTERRRRRSVTEGIGILRVTENFRRALVDDAMRVADRGMIDMLHHLAREDALVVGTSAALTVRAAYGSRGRTAARDYES